MKSRVKLIQPFSALYGCIWRCSKPGCPQVNISFHSIYSHREDENSSSLTISKGQFWAPWKPRKKNTAATNIIFSSTTAFHVPKVDHLTTYRTVFFPSLSMWISLMRGVYSKWPSNKKEHDDQLYINGICVVPFNFQTTPCQNLPDISRNGLNIG